jgi:hypothetical protein
MEGKLNKLHNLLEEFQNVRYRMDNEGFHYCFESYSSFDELEDDKFHKLREEYHRVSEELENYVEKKISDLLTEISDLENEIDEPTIEPETKKVWTFEEVYDQIVENSRGNLTNEEYRELITLEYVVTQGYDKVGDVERLNELRSKKR